MKALSRVISPLFVLTVVLFSAKGWALSTLPPCLDHGKTIGPNNDQVVLWKSTTQNQFLARGHVTGVVHKVYPDHNGHTHFEINMDTLAGDTLEIVYNQSFGALPVLKPGMKIESCGDYITSTAQTGAYPASPDGAILHWVHNTTVVHGGHGGGDKGPGSAHEPGYVAVDGIVFGGF